MDVVDSLPTRNAENLFSASVAKQQLLLHLPHRCTHNPLIFHILTFVVPFIVSRIRSDHNEDNTSQILQEWGQNVKGLYHRVLVNVTSTPTKYEDASSPGEWSDSRYRQMIYLRQRALDVARKQWADYLFVSLPRTLYFSSECFSTSL